MTTTVGGLLTSPCSCGGANESCFKCGGWGYIDKIGIGRATPIAHGVGTSLGLSRSKSPKTTQRPLPQNLIQCPKCPLRVRKLRKHLTKVHAISPSQQVHLPQPAKSELVKCDSCASWIRQDRLGSHSSRVHRTSVSAFADRHPAETTRAGTSSISARSKEVTAHVPSSEHRFDATRDYYAAYRDNGQFGSHPSHDGFDDESAP
jgi:hypothetical protein